MLYRETTAAFFSEIHKKHKNKLCGQNVKFLNDKTNSRGK